MLLSYAEVQASLFRLFVLGCIHLLSSWSWSAILFVADPLPASTIQMHEGETLTRRMRGKPAHLGMTKTFKAFSVSEIFFVMQPMVKRSSTWKKIFYIFGSMCYLCSSGPWGSWIPRKMKCEPAAAARRHVAQKYYLLWWGREERHIFERRKEIRGLGLIMCVCNLPLRRMCPVAEYLWLIKERCTMAS